MRVTTTRIHCCIYSRTNAHYHADIFHGFTHSLTVHLLPRPKTHPLVSPQQAYHHVCPVALDVVTDHRTVQEILSKSIKREKCEPFRREPVSSRPSCESSTPAQPTKDLVCEHAQLPHSQSERSCENTVSLCIILCVCVCVCDLLTGRVHGSIELYQETSLLESSARWWATTDRRSQSSSNVIRSSVTELKGLNLSHWLSRIKVGEFKVGFTSAIEEYG